MKFPVVLLCLCYSIFSKISIILYLEIPCTTPGSVLHASACHFTVLVHMGTKLKIESNRGQIHFKHNFYKFIIRYLKVKIMKQCIDWQTREMKTKLISSLIWLYPPFYFRGSMFYSWRCLACLKDCCWTSCWSDGQISMWIWLCTHYWRFCVDLCTWTSLGRNYAFM